MEENNFAPITIALITNGYLFNYATKFRFENSEISNPKSFKINNSQFEDFKVWLKDSDFSYSTILESSISDLEQIAKEERYFTRIESQITNLHNEIMQNKLNDLNTFKEEISIYLKQEIIGRYYLEEGKIESLLTSDLEVIKSIEVLENQSLMKKILSRN